MEFSPFWLTRITFSNMNPFTGADMFLVQNLVMFAAGAGLRLVLRKKLAARIWGLILVLGWAVLEIIADFAALTEMGAPLTGLSEVIVDIVESGRTLAENGLTVLEEVCDISARFVVNRVSMKMERERILSIVEKLRAVMEQEGLGNEAISGN